MKPAILYVRYSPRPKRKRTNGKDEEVVVPCESCELQLEHCRRWCEAHGYALIATYRDDAKSGANMRRQGLLQALAHVRNEPGTTLVVYNLSRLSRNTIQALAIARRIADAGSYIASTSETVDLNTPEGRLTLTIQCAVNQYNRETSSIATAHAMQRRVCRGMPTGGRISYGWKKDPVGLNYLKNDDEQAVIARMMQMSAGGLTPGAIARTLNSEGITIRGGTWQQRTVDRILDRESRRVAGTSPV